MTIYNFRSDTRNDEVSSYLLFDLNIISEVIRLRQVEIPSRTVDYICVNVALLTYLLRYD